MRRKIDPAAPFQSITGAAYQTGFSQWFIRKGCREGSIPHIRVGGDYRINMPAWLDQLNRQSGGEQRAE